MKCPFDHRNWALENLDEITSWIAANEDNAVFIVNREFVENNTASQRLAADMLERMYDPFFRFYGKMATDDKASLNRDAVIQRFKSSAEFRRLAKKLREEMSLDDDEEVLRRYYGAHYLQVLADRIAPYANSIAALTEAKLLESSNPPPQVLEKSREENVVETLNKAAGTVQADAQETLEELVQNDLEQSILFQHELDEELHREYEDPQPVLGLEEPIWEERAPRKARARGDPDNLLPPRRRDQDYFERDLVQVLDGTKAAMQEESLRSSYLTHLENVVKHIRKHNVPKPDWPRFLQRFELHELETLLNLKPVNNDGPCPDPSNLGFELIRNGRPQLDPTRRLLTISCEEGFVLRGPRVMYCENGRWITRENQMPVCEDAGRRPTAPPNECGSPPSGLIKHASLVPTGPGRLIVQCDPTYVLRGNPELICTRGRWIPSGNVVPDCISDTRSVDTCRERPPRAPANGSVTDVHMLTGNRVAVVRFMCNDGFGLHGPDYAKCDRGVWSPLPPICVPNSQDQIPANLEMPQIPNHCPVLRVPNGRVHYYAEGPSYARVTCAPGYSLYGQAKIVCNENDKSWVGPTPSCVAKIDPSPVCPRISPPLNGDVVYVTGTAVRFSCRPGYRLEGREQTTCYQGRWRDVPPRCVPDRPSPRSCNPEDPVVSENAIVFPYSDGRWFECSQGYTLVGANAQLCRNGFWDPVPICIARPGSVGLNSTKSIVYPITNCPLPPRNDDVVAVARGETVYYRCRQRDAQLVGPTLNQCVNGRWASPIAPSCLRRAPPPTVRPVVSTRGPQQRCQPGRIRGGDGYLYSDGKVIHYQCHKDYYIRGATSLRCELSRWSQPLPECVPLDGQSWPLQNGEIFYEGIRCHMPVSYSYARIFIAGQGRSVTYTCVNDPTKTTTQTCSPYGDWSGPTPDCGSKGVCEPQEIINGKFFQYRDDVGYIQCDANHTIENGPIGQRLLQTYCLQSTGVWDFGVKPPRCVPDTRTVDTRPEPEVEDPNVIDFNNGRFQIDECPPPQVSSNYTWLIQGEGRKITLGCRGQPSKRSVGELTCTNGGTWHHKVDPSVCSGVNVPSACSMDGRTIMNGQYFVYDENHYVFQCNKNYILDGNHMAVCPGYRPSYPKAISVLNENLDLPRCIYVENDLRASLWEDDDFSDDDVDAHFGGRQCHWPKEFAYANDTSGYWISKSGQEVTFSCSGVKKTVRCENGQWVGDDLSCIEYRHQQRGCEDRQPNEPQFGTYYQYQSSQSETLSFYFQCNTGYSLRGQAIVPCTDPMNQREPQCVRETDPKFSLLKRERNPEPFSIVQCPPPPVRQDNGLIAVQGSGDTVIIRCLPGYTFEGTSLTEQTVTCQRERWSVSRWPLCVQRGDRTYIRTPRYDPYGRPSPQELTGAKAETQNMLLRQQFLDHTRQMAEFRERHSQRLRSQGGPSATVPASLPILPDLPVQVRQELEDSWDGLHDEGRQIMSSYLNSRIRVRRKNHPPTMTSQDTLVEIPESLKSFEKDIRRYKLGPEDLRTLELMSDDLRLKYIEDRRKGIAKTKDDPVQSRKFLSRVFGANSENEPSNSDVVEQLRSHQEAGSSPRTLTSHIKTEDEVSPTTEALLESTKVPELSTTTSSTTDSIESSSPTATETFSSITITGGYNATTPEDVTDVPEINRTTSTESTEDFAKDDEVDNKIDHLDHPIEEIDNEVNDSPDSETTTSASENEVSNSESDGVVSVSKTAMKVKKGYDTSCADMGNEAPQIDNGFVLSYELLESKETQMLRVTYRCDPDYKFRYEHTSSLLCRRGEWIGEAPQCIPDDEED